MKYKNKGFTLVEMIVSIAIAAIVLMVVGSLILSSSGLLTNSAEKDLDKRTVDSIIDFVRSEMSYASDVRLVIPGSKYQPTQEEQDKGDWHSIYIENGHLYRDEKSVFNDNFYSKKTIKLSAQGNYENSQRIDMKYTMNNGKEDTYSSRDTIMFVNLKVSDEIKKNGLYTSDYVNVSNTEYKIYYNKKYDAPTPSISKANRTGTVEDIQDNIFHGNYKGLFVSTAKYQYKKGEIVWYDGFWWECLFDGKINTPGTAFAWKCLDKNFTHEEYGTNKIRSGYEKGDIIIFKDNYYQYKLDVICESNYDLNITNSNTWDLVGKVGDDVIEKKVKKNKYVQKNVYQNENVVKKYFPKDISMKDPLKISVAEYNPYAKYTIGDIVKVENTNAKTNQFYDIYIKIFNQSGAPNSKASFGWLKIDVAYSSVSSYKQGDIVVYENHDLPWYKAITDINSFTDITNEYKWQRL